MNVALIGYGRMGHEIRDVALERGHETGLIIDLENANELNKESFANIDVAIEFSNPGSAPGNIMKVLSTGTPVVSGTTGWLERWDEVAEACSKHESGLFYASNFSIGVNVLFEINRKLARLMESFEQYDVSILEKHHIHKLDAPSGTAISLAEQIIDNNSRKSRWQLDHADHDTIPVEAVREGEIRGIHHVTYESDVDILQISHTAKSRKAFAAGAVLAAEFMKGRSGIFGMKDLLNI